MLRLTLPVRRGASALVGVVLLTPLGVLAGTGTAAAAETAQLELDPASSTIVVGAVRHYRAYVVVGQRRGPEVTASTTFEIGAQGHCLGAACGADVAGGYDVVAHADLRGTELTGQARLAVVHERPVAIVVDPPQARVAVRAVQGYQVLARDGELGDLGDVTGLAALHIEPGGSCPDAGCSADLPGRYAVSATVDRWELTAKESILDVVDAPIAGLRIEPAGGRIVAGARQRFAVVGLAADDAELGDVTGLVRLRTDASCGPDGWCTATKPGRYPIQAELPDSDVVSTPVTLTVVAGDPASITLSPESTSVGIGVEVEYTVSGFDQYENPLGELVNAQVSIDGTVCPARICSRREAGDYTVTASLPGADVGRVTAQLHVLPDPVESIQIRPDGATVQLGATQDYTVEGYGPQRRPLGEVTSKVEFRIEPDGSCEGAGCTPAEAGDHRVIGRLVGSEITQTVVLHVLGPQPPGEPTTPTTTAPTTVRPTTTAPTTTAPTTTAPTTTAPTTTAPTTTAPTTTAPTTTAPTTLPTTPSVGPPTPTSSTASPPPPLSAPPPSAGPESDPSPPTEPTVARIELTPPTATISVGAQQRVTVHAYDRAGTDLGDVTAQSTISMTPDGSCPAARCSTVHSGPHEIVAIHAGQRARSHVDVRPRLEIAALVLDPTEATVTVGAGQAYRIRAVDARNADLGDVTDRATLTVEAPGRCDDRCGADRPAELEVTATLSGASGHSRLHVVPDEPAVLMVDPAAPAVAPGTHQEFHVRGLDANRNDLGDVTVRSRFALRPEDSGSCTAAVCLARTPGDHTVSVSLARRQGGPLLASVPFRVVAPEPAPSRVPWLLIAAGAALLLAGGATLVRTHPQLPAGQPIRLAARPAATEAEVGSPGPTDWTVRIQPHPDPEEPDGHD